MNSFAGGEFQLLRPHQALEETRRFIENLALEGAALYSDHHSNYAWVNGRLPDDREKMIRTIDELLELSESSFRPPGEGSL